MNKGSICILTTVSMSIKAFYRGQVESLQKAGFKVTIVCAEDEQVRSYLPNGTCYYPVSFSRTIRPFSSIKLLFQLIRFFRKERFDIIQYSTPAASLLASIAAFFARAPNRIYILWGLYYTGSTGVKRRMFKMCEKLICSLSSRIIPISHEMVDFAVSEGLARRQKFEVMLNGSACGVDLDQFDPGKWKDSRYPIRNQFNIPLDAVVIGTVARLTGDKGINELVQAFDLLSKQDQSVFLLLVGSQEEKDRLNHVTEKIINENRQIRMTGWQENPLPFYAAMDIFCLPTYREGFGEVNLEAQAMALPVISTNVIGPRESVEDGTTGILVEPRSSEAVYKAMVKLAADLNLRKQMGQKGRDRVKLKFDRVDIINAIVNHRLAIAESMD